MVIKSRNIIISALIFFLSLNYYNRMIFYESNNNNYQDKINTSITFNDGDKILHDKVHTLSYNQPYLTISNLTLEYLMEYEISLAVVTDNHVCTMDVNITDPVGDEYWIYRSKENMVFGVYHDIPFAAVLSGNYTFTFYMRNETTLNIHIKISKFSSHLEEGDMVEVEGKKIYYIKDGNQIIRTYSMDNDYMYYYSFTRLNPVAYPLDPTIFIDCNITDNQGNEFIIYQNQTITDVLIPLQFPFGTAVDGDYTFTIIFRPTQPFFNLKLKMFQASKISTETNSTDQNDVPDDNDTNNTSQNTNNIFANIPVEFTIGIIGGIGLLTVFSIGLITLQRRKNPIPKEL